MGTTNVHNMAAWHTTGFGCIEDPAVCCLGWLCPCVVYGQTSEVMSGDGCLMPAVLFNCCPLCTVCLWAPARRKQLRTDLGGLPEEPFGDCLFWCLCTSCANCQEARELKKQLALRPKTQAQIDQRIHCHRVPLAR